MKIIPSFHALSDRFKDVIRESQHNPALKNIVALYISNWSFDENWYLDSNPDLHAAFPSSVFPTAFSHFVAVGYLEGRTPVEPIVDTNWYLSFYPDVAAAIIKGMLDSADEHFRRSGYREGRLPGDPEIDTDWYIRTYLPSAADAQDKAQECLHHFIDTGYLNGALPRPMMR